MQSCLPHKPLAWVWCTYSMVCLIMQPLKVATASWCPLIMVLHRVAAAAAAEVAEAPAELIGSPDAANFESITTLSPDASGLPARIPSQFGQLSYSKQYDHLFATMPLDVKKPVPKPNPLAQQVQMAEPSQHLDNAAVGWASQSRAHFCTMLAGLIVFRQESSRIVLHLGKSRHSSVCSMIAPGGAQCEAGAAVNSRSDPQAQQMAAAHLGEDRLHLRRLHGCDAWPVPAGTRHVLVAHGRPVFCVILRHRVSSTCSVLQPHYLISLLLSHTG
jgi:hypothetical protein